MTSKLAELADLTTLAHRAVATAVETFIAVWIVDGVATIDAGVLEMAFASAIGAALVVVKEYAAKVRAATG